jgi:ABC-type multidrug transport system ATPase subunit
MSTPALRVQGLGKRFGRRVALDEFNLVVPRGSVFGLVGSNGAGKTTLMACCAGLLRPDHGVIDIMGAGPPDPGRRKGVLTLLPQDARLPLHARVGEILSYYGRLQGVSRQAIESDVDRLLGWVNLLDRKHAAVRTLSHGMMRRLTVAQAFLGEPDVVFLDEPMSGLDPREVSRIREMLVKRKAEQTVVISSHILGELETLCDHVAFVEKGRLVKQGSISSIMKRHHRLEYHVRPAPLPEDRLREIMVTGTWHIDAALGRISLILNSDEHDPVEINGRVLRLLLDAGIGVEEVRRGSDLEREFLIATERPERPA